MKHEPTIEHIHRAFEKARSLGSTVVHKERVDDPEPRPLDVVLSKTGAGVVAPNPLPPRRPKNKQQSSETLLALSAPLIELLQHSNIVVHDYHLEHSHEIAPSNLLFQKGSLDQRCKKLYTQALKSLGSEESQ